MRKGSITSSIVSRGSLSPAARVSTPDRSAAVEIGDHRQVAPVHRVEAKAVDLKTRQRLVGDTGVDRFRADRMGEVADAAKQATGDARRAARTSRDLA